tara:strand:- start:1215 stop:3719 length:2505 start_codon:yes stop_codon:yes gene_type:complete
MLTPEEQMKIISQATSEGYKGRFTDLLTKAEQDQAAAQGQQISPEQTQIAQLASTPISIDVPEKTDPNAGFVKPTSDATRGGLVQSYDQDVSGVGNFQTGDSLSNQVLFQPSEYKTGGFSNPNPGPNPTNNTDEILNFSSSDVIKNNEFELKNLQLEQFKPEDSSEFDVSGNVGLDIKGTEEMYERIMHGNMRMTFGNDNTDFRAMLNLQGAAGDFRVKNSNLKNSFATANISGGASYDVNDKLNIHGGANINLTNNQSPSIGGTLGASYTFEDGGFKYEGGGGIFKKNQPLEEVQFTNKELFPDKLSNFNKTFEGEGDDLTITQMLPDIRTFGGNEDFTSEEQSDYFGANQEQWKASQIKDLNKFNKKWTNKSNRVASQQEKGKGKWSMAKTYGPLNLPYKLEQKRLQNLPTGHAEYGTDAVENFNQRVDQIETSQIQDPEERFLAENPEADIADLTSFRVGELEKDYKHEFVQQGVRNATTDFVEGTAQGAKEGAEWTWRNKWNIGDAIATGLTLFPEPITTAIGAAYLGGRGAYKLSTQEEDIGFNLATAEALAYMLPGAGLGGKAIVGSSKLITPGINVSRTNALLNPISNVVRTRNALGQYSSVKNMSNFNPSKYKLDIPGLGKNWKNVATGRNVVSGKQGLAGHSLQPIKSTNKYVNQFRNTGLMNTLRPAGQGVSIAGDLSHLYLAPKYASGFVDGIGDIAQGNIHRGTERIITNATEFINPVNKVLDLGIESYKITKDLYGGKDFDAIARAGGGSTGRSTSQTVKNILKGTRKINKLTEGDMHIGESNWFNKNIYNLQDNSLLQSIFDPVADDKRKGGYRLKSFDK